MKIARSIKRAIFGAEPSFSGTGKGRMRGWVAPSTGTNTAIIYSLSELRTRSRDLTRNFSYMKGAYEVVASNIIGPGINVMPKHDDCAVCDKLRQLWDDWCEECDIEGVNSLDQILCLLNHERWEAGEGFLRFVYTDTFPIPLKLQVLSADQCKIDENHINADGSQTIGGVTIDKNGTVIRYTFYKANPDESIVPLNTYETEELDASEICHYFKQIWPGQRRGIPEVFSSIVKARDMLEYDEAELAKKKMAAMMAAFVTTPSPEGVLNTDPDDPDVDEGEAMARITTGTITTLAPGEDIKFNPPSESGSSYEPFMLQNLRALARSVGLTYEEFSNDMSKANFSSIRAGLNITQRQHRQEQKLIIHQVLRRIWEEFVKSAILSGAAEIDPEEYVKDPKHFTRARFQAPGWPYVNPQQEIAAQKDKVRCGFASRAQIVAENGFDVADIDNQIAADAERASELGLVYDTDPTGGMGAPKPQTAETTQK